MPRKIDRLLFVYNAESGTLNAIIDSARKLLESHAAMRDLEVPYR